MSNAINENMEINTENTEEVTPVANENSTENKETTSHKCAFHFPKFSEKEKRQLVKHGMVASLAITALSSFLPIKYYKPIHTVAGLSFLGLCAVHTIQNTPKKKK